MFVKLVSLNISNDSKLILTSGLGIINSCIRSLISTTSKSDYRLLILTLSSININKSLGSIFFKKKYFGINSLSGDLFFSTSSKLFRNSNLISLI